MSPFLLKLHFEVNALKTFPVTNHHLQTLANSMIKFIPFLPQGKIVINVVEQTTMAQINQQHYPFKSHSDVLSFPLVNDLTTTTADTIIGEVYINFQQTQLQAATYQHSWLRESCYLIVHGILHLLGYDHKTKLEQQLMRYWEKFLVSNQLGIRRQN